MDSRLPVTEILPMAATNLPAGITLQLPSTTLRTNGASKTPWNWYWKLPDTAQTRVRGDAVEVILIETHPGIWLESDISLEHERRIHPRQRRYIRRVREVVQLQVDEEENKENREEEGGVGQGEENKTDLEKGRNGNGKPQGPRRSMRLLRGQVKKT
ncbi:hypothetical protein B0H14DRAFT_155579 [Mycena olivaceomarginata]|nr:hypothetical protein B0H14DRAFT_155579 [Mycena olivaceomarginata]